jgi:2,3-bisphosphoglycerate-dependent phosphoglycerate mutase
MQLYIIRHAQSTNNALLDQRYRVSDPPLTELGYRQAELLAEHLANGIQRTASLTIGATTGSYGITRLYCSPMRRSLQTALPVGQALGLRPEVWIDIHEYGGIWLDHGDERGIVGYPGITRGDLEAEFPGYAIPKELTERGWWSGAQEEAEEFVARVNKVTSILYSWADRDERIAIITHGAFLDGLFSSLLEVNRSQPLYYHHDNVGVSRLDFRREGRLSIRYLNRLDHLPAEMVSA